MSRLVNRIVFHHSAGTRMDSAINTMKSKGTHYHRLVDQNGKIEKMREYNQIAYHAGAKGNTASIGICLIGNFTKTQPTIAQLNAVRDLVIDIHKIYGPLQYQNHRDVSATLCPVVDLKTIIRDLVLTKEKDNESQKPPKLDKKQTENIKRAIELKLLDIKIDEFDIEIYDCLEMVLKLYDLINKK